ncbi:hypothetical protein TNCV_2313641 [Trichonephila clavipes]|nr:hypothetical protein TNCV_2313641 [Trichonephila clavipes]
MKIAGQHAIQQPRWESELNELRLEIESIRSNVKRTSCAEDRGAAIEKGETWNGTREKSGDQHDERIRHETMRRDSYDDLNKMELIT